MGLAINITTFLIAFFWTTKILDDSCSAANFKFEKNKLTSYCVFNRFINIVYIERPTVRSDFTDIRAQT